MHKPQTVAKRLLKLFGPKGQHWTRGTSAKNRKGNGVGVNDKEAFSFCLTGALEKIGVSIYGPFGRTFTEKLELQSPDRMVDFNDGHRWPTIKKVLTEIAAGK